jgi:hypothetical protein
VRGSTACGSSIGQQLLVSNMPEIRYAARSCASSVVWYMSALDVVHQVRPDIRKQRPYNEYGTRAFVHPVPVQMWQR